MSVAKTVIIDILFGSLVVLGSVKLAINLYEVFKHGHLNISEEDYEMHLEWKRNKTRILFYLAANFTLIFISIGALFYINYNRI